MLSATGALGPGGWVECEPGAGKAGMGLHLCLGGRSLGVGGRGRRGGCLHAGGVSLGWGWPVGLRRTHLQSPGVLGEGGPWCSACELAGDPHVGL